VQSSKDVEHLRTLLRGLGSKARIIAKIETKAAVDNLEEIILSADAVMIARGDLAVETLPESVPVLQRHIIGLGRKYKKPTIVATQMLVSMTEQPEPTRAEVSDVATAVIVGADATMLSDETATGQYPIEAIKVMKRVILYTQNNSTVTASFAELQDTDAQANAISAAVIGLAQTVGAKAIVAETKSGTTAIQIASFRPNKPVIAVTSDQTTTNQLAIVYGVKSYQRPVDKFAATKLTNWLRNNKVLTKGDIIVTASGQYPGVVGTTDTIKVRVL
jgi:pyruvate kinase